LALQRRTSLEILRRNFVFAIELQLLEVRVVDSGNLDDVGQSSGLDKTVPKLFSGPLEKVGLESSRKISFGRNLQTNC
jgi:hypothetical protein